MINKIVDRYNGHPAKLIVIVNNSIIIILYIILLLQNIIFFFFQMKFGYSHTKIKCHSYNPLTHAATDVDGLQDGVWIIWSPVGAIRPNVANHYSPYILQKEK